MAIRTTTIDGMDNLIKTFIKLGEKALPYLREGTESAADVILRKTKDKAPVLEGGLEKNLKRTKAKKSKKYPYRVFSMVKFTPKTEYGVFVELGHRLVGKSGQRYGVIREQPFMRPATAESKNEVVDIISKSLEKAIKDMGGRG